MKLCRSRKGAWIEIIFNHMGNESALVAPVRERGLKLLSSTCTGRRLRRSRKGAWIEIQLLIIEQCVHAGRSRKGAWIEIQYLLDPESEEARRSRKGAWIEMTEAAKAALYLSSLP